MGENLVFGGWSCFGPTLNLACLNLRYSGTCSDFKDKFNKALRDDDIVDAVGNTNRSRDRL